MLNDAHRKTSEKNLFADCLQQVITQNVYLIIITNTQNLTKNAVPLEAEHKKANLETQQQLLNLSVWNFDDETEENEAERK